ncbi:MAG: glycosyltransferase [Clostridia bacterium]|nr:glycosyltransferase [Clostridia bacterium]
MKKEKIIFVYPKKASFIDLDIDILSRRFVVIQNTYNWKNKLAVPIFLIKQFFFILSHLRFTKLIVVSFGGYWALVPTLLGRIFKKPVFIILHGTDCASFPDLNYGNLRKPVLKFILRFSYRMATRLLPVSASLVYTENTYYQHNNIVKQGYKHFFKNNNTPFTVLHNGINTDVWEINPKIERIQNRFITVLSEGQFWIKGGDLIIEAAKKLSEFNYVFVGINQAPPSIEVPVNVTFAGRLSPIELFKVYNTSNYYLQLSITEGFGVALCEAMACGCTPIVSNVNMLPEIVGNSGYVLPERDTEKLVKLILEDVLKEKRPNLSLMARQRIVENYSESKRAKALLEVLANG